MGLTLALTLHPIRFWATKNPPWFPGRIICLVDFICLVDSGRAMVTKRLVFLRKGRDHAGNPASHDPVGDTGIAHALKNAR